MNWSRDTVIPRTIIRMGITNSQKMPFQSRAK